MRHYRTILIIAIIEILIGSITIFYNLLAIALNYNNKSPGVLCFVIVAGILSTLIGVGLLKFNKHAYELLIFFSIVVILSKILILMHVIQLNGALETTIPGPVKRTASIVYHAFVLYYLRKKGIREIFQAK